MPLVVKNLLITYDTSLLLYENSEFLIDLSDKLQLIVVKTKNWGLALLAIEKSQKGTFIITLNKFAISI